MSERVAVPRDYQIEELTRSIQRPLRKLESRHLYVIAKYLINAWSGLLRDYPTEVVSGQENEVNALMESRLNNTISDCDWSLLIQGVTRGKESFNYDGCQIEKRPDLSIHLTSWPFHLPLVVECKLIDRANGKSIDLYCKKGLSRFIIGEYAWYAHDAFMLGYVRDNSTPGIELSNYVNRHSNIKPDPYLTESLPNQLSPEFEHVYQSRHGRAFPANPGSVSVYHIWLYPTKSTPA